MTKIPFTDIDLKIMAREYRRGICARELADRMKVSRTTILRVLKRAGVEVRPRGRAPAVSA